MKVKSNWKRTMTATAVGTAILGVNLLWAGEEDGNKFEFDKTVYNASEQKTTEIKVIAGKGYKFSGKSKKISGNSTIEGTTVDLHLSTSKEDTQVAGSFIHLQSETEKWVTNKIKVIVIEHYITRAVHKRRPPRKPKKITFYATVVALPQKLGEPNVTVKPSGFEIGIPMEVKEDNHPFDGEYHYELKVDGDIEEGGVITSNFFGTKTSAKTAPNENTDNSEKYEVHS
jgi:hypothetical protein